jgi:hypothetical protein
MERCVMHRNPEHEFDHGMPSSEVDEVKLLERELCQEDDDGNPLHNDEDYT